MFAFAEAKISNYCKSQISADFSQKLLENNRILIFLYSLTVIQGSCITTHEINLHSIAEDKNHLIRLLLTILSRL
jgi:hypothetical protein